MNHDLVGRIYEAAVLPEMWSDVLSGIGDEIGQGGCTLITVDGECQQWVSSRGIEDVVTEYFASGWAERNDRIERTLQNRTFGCVRDVDLWSREDIEKLAVVREFLRPRGLGWGAAILNELPNGEFLMLSVERSWDAGPVPDRAVELLHGLQPHLMRSALLSAKLRFERAKAAVETFGLISVPAALVRANGRVLAANDLFAGIGAPLRIGRDDLLKVASPGASDLLDAALRGLRAADGSRSPFSIAVPAAGEERPLVLHVLPAEGQTRDLFGSASALLLVTRVEAPGPLPGTLLQALFDLTPAEARVAKALLAGDATDEIAQSLGVRRETVRNQVKSILRKTGMQRRGDLARFVSSVTVFDQSAPAEAGRTGTAGPDARSG
jgi:DNA-binding CsgD family transcriptional regulator